MQSLPFIGGEYQNVFFTGDADATTVDLTIFFVVSTSDSVKQRLLQEAAMFIRREVDR